MLVQSHLSYPILLAYIAQKAFGIPLVWADYALIAFFSWFPDSDYVYSFFKHKDKILDEDLHIPHHEWPLHWPVLYLPFWILALVTGHWFWLIFFYATALHFIMDSLYGGINWAAPWKKWTINLQPSSLDGLSHVRWVQAYRKVWIYKLDWIATIATIAILIYEVIQIL